METLYVFIDESGSFSYRRGRSYIGGWVSYQKHLKSIENKLKLCVSKFNKFLNSKSQNYQLNYPHHLHFMPLHVKAYRKGKDQAIPLVPKYAPIFFRDLFTNIRDELLLVFKSSGMPAIIPNEHSAYIDILRNTLVQLVDDKLFNTDSNVKIVIGHRRSEAFYGIDGYEDIHGYEKYLSEKIAEELKSAFDGKKMNVGIEFDNARKNPGLIMADFFCGALRWDNENYLEGYKNIRTYSFANGYRRVSKRIAQRIKFLDEMDSVLAAIQCSEVISSNPADLELKTIFKRIVDNLDQQQKVQLYDATIKLMDEYLLENPDRYNYLDLVENLIEVFQKILPPKHEEMSPSELRLQAALKLNTIRITSHRGLISNGLMKSYLTFLKKYGDAAFGNQLEIIQHRIDAVLMGAQVQAFNAMQFEDVESILKETRDDYIKMLENRLDREGAKDRNAARLEGTLGQMYAFQYDITGEDIYYEFADHHLTKDISACIPGTSEWEQGMGYLTDLYWKNGDLDKACANFLKESHESEKSKDMIFNIAMLDQFQSAKKPFIFLHRLKLCALARKQEIPIKNNEKAAEFLLSNKKIHKYPQSISAKWLGILFAMDEKYTSALMLFNEALKPEETRGFTVELIQLPLKICRHLCLKATGKRSSFDCENEVSRLDNIQKGTKEILRQLGIKKYYGEIDPGSLYDIGTLLPFYYS
jgi:hypothetical protein